MTDLDPADELLVRDRLAHAVGALEAPTARIEQHARRVGTARRRTRRAALAGVGVLSAVVAGVVSLGGPDGPDRAVDAAATTPSAPEVRAGTASASFPHLLSLVDVSAHQVLRRLRPVLPTDAVTSGARFTIEDAAPGDSTEVRGGVVVVVDREDTSRRGSVEVRLFEAPTQPLAADDPDLVRATSCPATDYTPPPTTCETIAGAGGLHGRALESRDDGFVIREVLVPTTTGRWVYVADANSTDDKWGPGYDSLPGEPPLSLAELESVARSAAWDDIGS